MRRRRACAPVLVLVTIIIPKDNIFLPVVRMCKTSAVNLTVIKRVLCRMTEKEQADVVQSRKAVFVRCCLKCKKSFPEKWEAFCYVVL